MSLLLKAQQADTLLALPVDTGGYMTDEVTDTVAVDALQDEFDDEEDGDDENEEEKNYFLLKEITAGRNGSLQLRQLPDSFIQALQGDDDFWYANTVFEKIKKQKEATAKPGRQPKDLSWLSPLAWIIIVGSFILLLAVLLMNSNVSLFRRSKSVNREQEEEETETEDIFAINYQKEIDKAVGAGNFRLAIRFMFLRQLRNLSDKNIIQYTQDKTNFDYLLQLHNTSWYPGFFRIVRNYEYAWYGHFEVDREKFNIIRSDFDGFDKQLNRN
jgi:hypothetical protein